MSKVEDLDTLVCSVPLTCALGQLLKQHPFGKAICVDLSVGSGLAQELQDWDDPCEQMQDIFIEMGLHVTVLHEEEHLILMKTKGWIYDT